MGKWERIPNILDVNLMLALDGSVDSKFIITV